MINFLILLVFYIFIFPKILFRHKMTEEIPVTIYPYRESIIFCMRKEYILVTVNSLHEELELLDLVDEGIVVINENSGGGGGHSTTLIDSVYDLQAYIDED